MQLRPPQRAACIAAARQLRVEPTLISSPTGTGKTVMGCALAEAFANKYGGPVLWVAPTDETLRQAAERFLRAGWVVQIDKAAEWAQPNLRMTEALQGAKVVIVASQGTLRMRPRIERYPREGWALCVMDECHHSPAATWLAIRQYFTAPWLGLSATPEPDGMANLWHEVKAFPGGITQAIQDGWLVPPDVRYVEMDNDDYDAMKAEDPAAVGESVVRPIRSMADVMGPRQGLTFWPRTMTAAVAAKYMQSPGRDGAPSVPGLPWTARSLSGKTSPIERKLAIRQYHARTLQVLSLCAVGIEGMDIPDASVLGIWRQTESAVMLSQMIGRVMRPLAGVLDGLEEATAEQRCQAISKSDKPHASIVSVASPDMHRRWATPGRLFYGHLPAPVLIDMEQRAKSGKSMEQAKKEAEDAEAERERVRLERAREAEQRLSHNAQWRARQLAEATPYRLRSEQAMETDTRRQWAESKWRDWAERARCTRSDADRATEKQALAVERLLHRYLAKPAPPGDGGKIAALVRTWDRQTASKAQFALRMRCGGK